MPRNANNWTMDVMGHHFMNIIEVYNREEMSDAVFIEIAASCKHHPSFKMPKKIIHFEPKRNKS